MSGLAGGGPANGGLALIDFDGTLCSTHDAVHHVIDLTFDHFSRARAPAQQVDAAIRSGVIVSEVFNLLLGHDADAGLGQDWAVRYREIYNSGEGLALTTLFPGVREGLSALAGAGWRCCLVSNKGVVALREGLAHFGLDGAFELVVGDQPGQSRKPDRRLYDETILPHLGPSVPARRVMIGDTETDLRFARAIGAEAWWAQYGFGDRDACLALAPELRLARFDAIAAALR